MWVALLAAKLRGQRTDNGGEFTAAEFATYCIDDSHAALLDAIHPAAEQWWSGGIRRWWRWRVCS
jgi:hypothetical protein